MGWLRSVGPIKLYISFAGHHLFYRALLQKRPIILSILKTVATPYESSLLLIVVRCKCVAMCCCVAVGGSVLQRVARVVQCLAARGSVTQCAAVCCHVLQCVAVCCSVLQCVAVWPYKMRRVRCIRAVSLVAVLYNVLQLAAVCCSWLQCVAVWPYKMCVHKSISPRCSVLQCVAVFSRVLQSRAVRYRMALRRWQDRFYERKF